MLFDQTMRVEQFQKQYYYRTELQQICRDLKLPSQGTKAELNQRIICYLDGEFKTNEPSRKNNARLTGPIRLDTKLLDGVKLNQTLRQFMADYYQKTPIKFTKQMAVALRQAKANQDTEMTVSDLLAIYEGKVTVDTAKDDVSYQWNQFLKDYCADPNNRAVKNKLQAAAKLWQSVKQSEGEKLYGTQTSHFK